MSHTLPPVATSARQSPWIVSPAWDLCYVVATPLLIVPAVLGVAVQVFTPEQIALAAISFASLGHHLPGFLRTYGDRELFVRFRTRFLLMPPLIFGLALLFSPPRFVAETFGWQWQHLHGLELILLLWGTWHGLMQTYGFMRIYDLKRGVDSLRIAWLDHALCLSMFVAGFVFSDARVYGTAEVLWNIGFPAFDHTALTVVRAIVGGALAMVLILYVVQLLREWRSGRGVCWLKVLLALLTGWVYWYTGTLAINMLIGLAIFEIYHAVQYDAIVWVYNRRASERTGNRLGPLGFLFRDRWSMFGLYLAFIVAYGLIRYSTINVAEFTFHGGDLDTHQLLIAFFVTSTIMHFYVDGFIWKVHEPRTKRDLFEGATDEGNGGLNVPTLVHAIKWALFFAAALGMLWLEAGGLEESSDHRTSGSKHLARLAALTPDLPELQTRLSRDALDQGKTDEAVELARKALARRPHSHAAYGDLAVALLAAGQGEAAVPLLLQAIAIEPDQWKYHANLGLAYAGAGKQDEAVEAYQRAASATPNRREPRRLLIELLLRTDRTKAALAMLRADAKDHPRDANPCFLLGNAMAAAGDLDKALVWYNETTRRRPNFAEAWGNLGAIEARLGNPTVAERSYRRALAINPRLAEVLYNLGGLLLEQGWREQAREHLRAARNLGRVIPPTLAKSAGLDE